LPGFYEVTAAGKEFRENIRSYNGTLSFTSLGANIDHSVANNRVGAYCFRIHGSIYHNIGGLLPSNEGDSPVFSQVYVYDTRNELANRLANSPHLTQATLAMLQEMMHHVSPFVTFFKNMAEVVRESGGAADVRLLIRAERSPDPRRYNAPTADEIGLLMSDTMTASNRDIVIRTR